MKIKVETDLNSEQIAYIFCCYYKKNKAFPKPKNGMYSAIRAYVESNGQPKPERVEACQNGAPILMSKATELVERYFPYSSD
jgi:hypothetical protein